MKKFKIHYRARFQDGGTFESYMYVRCSGDYIRSAVVKKCENEGYSLIEILNIKEVKPEPETEVKPLRREDIKDG